MTWTAVGRVAGHAASSKRCPPSPSRRWRTGDTVVDVLKVGIVVLVVLIVLLGLPLGIPMSGFSMCPECSAIGTWGLMCIALVGSIVLLLQRRLGGTLLDRLLRPLPVMVPAIERPPRTS